jgi:hypothetical protein
MARRAQCQFTEWERLACEVTGVSEPAPVIRIVRHRTENTCVAAALASLLGVTYEQVIAVGAQVDPQHWQWGWSIGETEEIARRLGRPLRRRRTYDLDEDTGLLSLTMRPRGHLALLVDGRIYSMDELDGSVGVWRPDVYLAYHKARPGLLLVAE